MFFRYEQIKKERERKGLTQAALASKLGTTRQHVQRIESKGRITVATLVSVLEALGVDDPRPFFCPKSR